MPGQLQRGLTSGLHISSFPPLVLPCSRPSQPLLPCCPFLQGVLDRDADFAITGVYGDLGEDPVARHAVVMAVERAALEGLDVVGLRTVYSPEKDGPSVHSGLLRDPAVVRRCATRMMRGHIALTLCDTLADTSLMERASDATMEDGI